VIKIHLKNGTQASYGSCKHGSRVTFFTLLEATRASVSLSRTLFLAQLCCDPLGKDNFGIPDVSSLGG
jgi:hypothetical protein